MSRKRALDDFTRAYIEAALWSTNDESDETGGVPLDNNYSAEDIAPDTMAAMQRDCADFKKRYAHIVEDDNPKGRHDRWELAGHDFWLTRNGHGAGFWDGDWPKHGDELTRAAKSYGTFDLYVGEDGAIHGSPIGNDGASQALEERRRVGPRRTVADFNTRQDLIEHERAVGATHVLAIGSGVTLFYPTRGRQYEENRAWKERGYWHGRAPSDRVVVDRLPAGAEPIESFLSRAGGRRAAAESRQVRDYIAVDNRGKRIAGPSKDYDAMKRDADRAGGYVQFSMGVSETARTRGAHGGRRWRSQSPGAQYAENQLNSDHFRDWMWDQMVEAEEIRRRDPSSVMSLESKADYAKLARNMLQQLEFDIQHDIDPRELENLTGSSRPGSAEVRQFFDDLHENLRGRPAIDWVADEAMSIRRQILDKPTRRASSHGPREAARKGRTTSRRNPLSHQSSTQRLPNGILVTWRKVAPESRGKYGGFVGKSDDGAEYHLNQTGQKKFSLYYFSTQGSNSAYMGSYASLEAAKKAIADGS